MAARKLLLYQRRRGWWRTHKKVWIWGCKNNSRVVVHPAVERVRLVDLRPQNLVVLAANFAALVNKNEQNLSSLSIWSLFLAQRDNTPAGAAAECNSSWRKLFYLLPSLVRSFLDYQSEVLLWSNQREGQTPLKRLASAFRCTFIIQIILQLVKICGQFAGAKKGGRSWIKSLSPSGRALQNISHKSDSDIADCRRDFLLALGPLTALKTKLGPINELAINERAPSWQIFLPSSKW